MSQVTPTELMRSDSGDCNNNNNNNNDDNDITKVHMVCVRTVEHASQKTK